MEPFATIFWATNHLPNAQDYSKALLRRVRIVEFNKSFEGEKKDTRIFENLKEESPGIIQMALNQYKQAISSRCVSESSAVSIGDIAEIRGSKSPVDALAN